jgi:hypothetical protein
MTRYGASMDRLSRGLDMIAGLFLIVIGMGELRHMRTAISVDLAADCVNVAFGSLADITAETRDVR